MTDYELLEKLGDVRARRRQTLAVLFSLLVCLLFALALYQGWRYFGGSVSSKLPLRQSDNYTLFSLWTLTASRYAAAYRRNGSEQQALGITNRSIVQLPTDALRNTKYDPLLVCYYVAPDSSNEAFELDLSTVNSTLCTHINVGMAYIHNSTIVIGKGLNNSLLSGIPALRKNNPSLKFLLWIGGGDTASEGFPPMIKTHRTRKIFIKSLIKVLRTYDLDGCDLDWEFPSAYQEERMHLSQLLYEIKQAYLRTNSSYKLSLAVAAPEGISEFAYDVAELNKYADHVNIMTYDFHAYTRDTPFTGINSPLHARKNESSIMATLNIAYCVNWWLRNGLDRKKVVVGLPTYGHSFRLVNPFNTAIGAPASNYGETGRQGFITASQACWFLQSNVISNLQFDTETCSPYASSGTEWISFEHLTSILCKTKYVKSLGLGGVMLFSLNTDDFLGICKDGQSFPLANAVRSALSLND